jgi:Tfp pilus assembly protein PilW
MKVRHTLSRPQAFTLVEVMVSMAVSIALLGSLIETSIVLQRSFTEADNASSAVNDEERVLDYISRDLREAYTVTVSHRTRP